MAVRETSVGGGPPTLFRTDTKQLEQLTLLEIRADKGSIGLFVDKDAAGVPVGYLIAAEREMVRAGQKLSQYILVRGKRVSDLDVESIYQLDDPGELKVIAICAGKGANTLMERGNYIEALDILEGIMIPAVEREHELLKKPNIQFNLASIGLSKTARRLGFNPVPLDIQNVLRQPTLESAVTEVDRMTVESASILLGICMSRMDESAQGPDIIRLTTHTMRKLVETIQRPEGRKRD